MPRSNCRETPAFNHLPSPLIGQHTREIVEGLLGYSRDELRAGFDDGTFWPTKRDRASRTWRRCSGERRPDVPSGTASRVCASSNWRTKPASSAASCSAISGPMSSRSSRRAASPAAMSGRFSTTFPHPERSLSFWYYNTSKRGITLNLETADGRKLFRRLAAGADVDRRNLPARASWRRSGSVTSPCATELPG